MKACGLTAAVINLSGGVDSAVSFALMKHAASLPESPVKRVVPIAQPISRCDRRRAETVSASIEAVCVGVEKRLAAVLSLVKVRVLRAVCLWCSSAWALSRAEECAAKFGSELVVMDQV